MIVEYKSVSVMQDTTEVLSSVSFSVEAGEFVYVVGKVGSGKSSLLKTLYGDLPIRRGEATVLGFDMARLKPRRLPKLRRQLGIIFQDFQLLADRTVEQNLRFVLKATGWKRATDISQRIDEALHLVGMEGKGDQYPYQLSGGEQQRIAIARAILNKPQLLLADEPTGNLDEETSRHITQLLHTISRQGSAVIMVTHNMALVSEFPARVLACRDHALIPQPSSTRGEEQPADPEDTANNNQQTEP